LAKIVKASVRFGDDNGYVDGDIDGNVDGVVVGVEDGKGESDS